MTLDWDAATVKVRVPVQHTATKDIQEIDVPLADFATMLLDLASKRMRATMARQAVERRQRDEQAATPAPTGDPT